MLRIGDKVRPTRDWYKDYIDEYWEMISYPDVQFWTPDFSDEQVDELRNKDVGIVSEINGGGVKGTEVSVEWIKTNKHKNLQPKNAWWEEEELEVISRNSVYSK